MADYRRPKRLNEMDDLRDMGRFPLPIYVGATGNILQTIVWTYVLHRRRNELGVLPVWAAAIIGANVLPVVVLRTLLKDNTLLSSIMSYRSFSAKVSRRRTG